MDLGTQRRLDFITGMRNFRFSGVRRSRAQPEPYASLDDVPHGARLAEIKCLQHDRLVALLVNQWLVTVAGSYRYPRTSTAVRATCDECFMSHDVDYWIDIRELQKVQGRRNRSAAVAKRAGSEINGVPTHDVLHLLPSWWLSRMAPRQ